MSYRLTGFSRRRYRPISITCFSSYNDILYRRGNRFTLPGRRYRRTYIDGRRAVVSKPEKENTQPDATVSPDLIIEDIDLKTSANSVKHHTNEYDLIENDTHLVVRRGQTFDIEIEFNKKYDKNKDDLRLVFLAGDNPSPTKGTRVSLILSDADEENKWGAWILEEKGHTLTIRINSPPSCFVGKWQLLVETILQSDTDNAIFEYKHDQDIYILFNPWCKDDTVYMADESLLEEYILNDTGKVYTGSKKQIHGKRWNFGQFEENVLDCAMYLLDRIAWTARGDPIKVCRKLSALTNSQDDNGVLVGNWSGNYRGGKSPCDWVGSVAILQEYFKTKQPVRYGQCWVFSGVLTTLHRTLGIPVRSVTNFSSAHDCDGSISIDSFWTETGEPMEELNHASIWNFHVMNEVWMARPDLPPGYGGWQAIDATPQETSEGVFCCGPASLVAIKRGEVYLPYDTPFVFAEVNADRVNWQFNYTKDPQNISLDKFGVGIKISTKLPKGKTNATIDRFCFDRVREDLTNQYKYPDGSDEERAAVIKANQNSTKKGLYDEGRPSDVDFKLVDKETVPFGKDFVISLKMKNKSKEERTVSGCISTSSMHYTGVPASKIKTMQMDHEIIPPNAEREIDMKVTFDEYYDLLVEQCHMKMSCMCKVHETKHTYVHQDTFRLIKPEMNIKVPSKGKVGEKMKADVSFSNPIPCALTNCQLTVEGPGLQNASVIPQGIVGEHKTFMTSVDFVPKKPGKKELVVSFTSNELSMVEGSCEILVVS